MALTSCDIIKSIILTIPAQSEVLTDFPVQINLTYDCGTSSFDASVMFNELTPYGAGKP